MRAVFLHLLLCLLTPAIVLSAELPNAESQPIHEPHLFDEFWKSAADSFTGSNLYLHGAAFASTGFLIKTGVDAKVYETFREQPNDATWPGAVIASGAGLAVAGLWVYFDGKTHKNSETIGAAYVMAQSALITGVYVKTLKTLTGRAHPSNTSHLSSQEQSESRELSGFKLTNGYGWPSGHVSHTVAITSALSHYYPHKTWLKWFGFGLSTYMLYTVSAHNSAQMHWFSDGVAGAFIGYAIGSSVGKNFRNHIDSSPEQTQKFHWLPIARHDYIGAIVHYEVD